ncbi:MAG: short-chain dehydrogenase [Azospirillum brasilense]|nr:MAG: short-chain dehydrogenase [Azospirillum brasilense]
MRILITGASSGLGAALAREYAAAGVTLFLSGRDGTRLQDVANDCRARGAEVRTARVDVTDKEAMHAYMQQCDASAPLDLVIANAGISAGTGGTQEPMEQVERIFEVNLHGVLHTIQPIIAPMLARGSGHIAIMSSLAGIRALPSCPAYSASKAAVRYYGDALRGVLKKQGVMVSVICPGYIHTPMTAVNDFPMPLVMDATRAARIIRCGLRRKKARIAFPTALYLPLWWLACLPLLVSDVLFARLPSKPQKS